MKIFYNLNDFLNSRASRGRFVVTTGVFDGVHRAHQRIIKTLIKKAKKRHRSSLLITFWPHPVNVLRPPRRVPLLISLKHRLCIFEELGLDNVIVLPFTRRLARMGAEGFIKKIFGKITVDEIIIGGNFFFGKNKRGSLSDLRKFSAIYGYRVSVINTLRTSGKVISSTMIRRLISKGELKKASNLLSRPVTVLGTVVKGHRRGRIIGFPTANIDPHHEAIPPSGVYAVRIKAGKKLYKGVLNIGIRPTFRQGLPEELEPTIEVHIFNFSKPLYGKDLEIAFVKKIRKEKKFKNPFLLREQITKDAGRARGILG